MHRINWLRVLPAALLVQVGTVACEDDGSDAEETVADAGADDDMSASDDDMSASDDDTSSDDDATTDDDTSSDDDIVADDDIADDDIADDDVADDDVADDDVADDDVADDDVADDDVADDDVADDDIVSDDDTSSDDDVPDDDVADDDVADDDVADDDVADDDVADDDVADDDVADDDTADDDVADDDVADDDIADDDVADDDVADDDVADDDVADDDVADDTFKLGAVALTQTETCIQGIGCFVASGAVGAYNVTTGATPSNCAFATVGDCQVYSCDPNVEVETVTPTQVNAGTITVTGLASPLPLDWMPASSGYISDAVAGWLWQGPEALTVTVSGSADVPAYSMQMTTPTPVTVTAPVLAGFEISRSTDIDVTWTGGVGGTFQFAVSGIDAPDSYQITCDVAASEGGLTVEAEALAGLPEEAGVSMGLYAAETQTVEDWTMVFEAVHSLGSALAPVGN